MKRYIVYFGLLLQAVVVSAQGQKDGRAVDKTLKAIEDNMVFVGRGNGELGLGGKMYDFFFDLYSYKMCKYDVTQAQWEAVMGYNPSSYDTCAACPVETVSWEDVRHFIIKLNKLSGKSYRLPTFEEWKFAATGQTLECYNGSNDIDSVSWFKRNTGGGTHPVGERQPNQLGLYDMDGNVFQWCQDWANTVNRNYYYARYTYYPYGNALNRSKVFVGGSVYNRYYDCWTYGMHSTTPFDRSSAIGFRLVEDL